MYYEHKQTIRQSPRPNAQDAKEKVTLPFSFLLIHATQDRKMLRPQPLCKPDRRAEGCEGK
jgi:hypothetical protein